MLIKQQLKTGYKRIKYIIFSFIFIKVRYTYVREIKKIMLSIKLIFYY